MPVKLNKYIVALLSLVVLNCAVGVQCYEHHSAVKSAFIHANIPQDLGIHFNPVAKLDITWPAITPQSQPLHPTIGAHLTDNYTIPVPDFKLLDSPHDVGPYVVFMLDPDAPSPEEPTSRSNRHFIGCNYYQTWGDHILRNTTKPPSRWFRPLPLPDTREHRYVFLVYKQPQSFDWTFIFESSTHQNFDIAVYARQNALGDPIAGNFFWIDSNASCWRQGCQ